MQPPYVGEKEDEGGWSGGRGGAPARTALRTLRANAECAYIGFHLYCFPFCHLLILWDKFTFCYFVYSILNSQNESAKAKSH